MHAHTIDAAQEGFYKACETTRGLRKAGFTEAKFPHWTKKFRTTIWKHTAIKRNGDVLELSCGGPTKKEREERKISLPIPTALRDCLRFLEVRLVYDKKARRYFWHIVVENGKQPKPSPGGNVVAVDLGEIHPAVVGDEAVATVITCRERRAQSQGHAKRLAKIQQAASRKQKGSRSHRRLMKAKLRMKAKHGRVMRDLEHKISRTIVATAVERKAGTIAIGDIRDIADGVDCGTVQNGRMSRWNHGKISDSSNTKRQPKGRGRTGRRTPHEPDVSQLRASPQTEGAQIRLPGLRVSGASRRGRSGQHPVGVSSWRAREIAAPSIVKYRIPHDMRVMRRCQDTGQERMPVARGLLREAVGL